MTHPTTNPSQLFAVPRGITRITEPWQPDPTPNLHAPAGPRRIAGFSNNGPLNQTLQRLLDTEWLLTTGHGAFAMGSALGPCRRRYHSLLNAALTPPVERWASFTLDESLYLDSDTTIRLAAHEIGPNLVERDARATLEHVDIAAHEVRWVFSAADIRITKSLRLARSSNACAIRYDIENAPPNARLLIHPILQLRDAHNLTPHAHPDDLTINATENTLHAKRDVRALSIAFTAGTFTPNPARTEPIHLFFEADRGSDATDRSINAGALTLTLSPNITTVELHAAFEPDTPQPDLFDNPSPTRAHLDRVLTNAPESTRTIPGLVEAADAYLVDRTVNGKALKTVIAGYPWFADWGRDTMISLPGLMLATGRHGDAFACLATFANYVSDGMIPNVFDSHTSEPQYNTVDASLWFLHAAAEYLRVSNDHAGYQRELLPAALAIIQGYRIGTRFNIRMDPNDALITAGDHTTQLTWMDAKRGGIVFTPRHGKAVEINALWRRGLDATADCLTEIQDPNHADTRDELRALAARAAESFNHAFTGGPNGGLHDCLLPTDDGTYTPAGELRPNQIFAVSLPGSPLPLDTQRRVVRCVADQLLTPLGLRTLAPGEPKYRPHFAGDMMSRDDAYHNGTAWPWLVGPLCEAILRTENFSDDAKQRVKAILTPLINSMTTGCVGHIAEVFDAEPRHPIPGESADQRSGQVEGGCPAQAWSVAEPLRVLALCNA